MTLSLKGFYFDPKKISNLFSKSHKTGKKYNKKDSKICHMKKSYEKTFFQKLFAFSNLKCTQNCLIRNKKILMKDILIYITFVMIAILER